MSREKRAPQAHVMCFKKNDNEMKEVIDLKEFRNSLENESDRGVVLISAELIHNSLKELFEKHLILNIPGYDQTDYRHLFYDAAYYLVGYLQGRKESIKKHITTGWCGTANSGPTPQTFGEIGKVNF